METLDIIIRGLVQGVGFRPFVYRIAQENNILGWVDNRTDGVYIKANGKKNDIHNFLKDLNIKKPPASKIEDIVCMPAKEENFIEFKIVKSKDITDSTTQVSPDLAVCKDCIRDMKIQANRINYPFINCTNCGPRFTIIKDLPYDRNKTTMSDFIMCSECSHEYNDVSDRRFHAQPVACAHCGPKYTLHEGNTKFTDFETLLNRTSELILSGKIIAIKGLGGFFITCDANNNKTVNILRKNKIREGKPFAVMFPDIETIKKYCYVSESEEKNLTSFRRPIVLLNSKKQLAKNVCNGFHTIGCFLPYMPIHYLLFEKIGKMPLIMTSGNISDEPIIKDNVDAISKLKPVCDAVLTYNRDIYNRNDDSVAFVDNDTLHLIRRSRGYVPNPVNLNIDTDNIVSAGAELVNTFCVGKGRQAILSQHIGDLKNMETYNFYAESFARFLTLFRVKPKYFACDMHPEYLSTKFARESGIKIFETQHHHAHIASAMAEHNLDEKVIGIAFDGTGLGIDNKTWGGEFFIADLKDFKRLYHFDYIPIPGGDSATKEPWKTGLSYLYKVFGTEIWNLNISFTQNLNRHNAEIILDAIDKKINCPESSSAGRLFDSISSILSICTKSTFHAEAPMRLENIAKKNIPERYNYNIISHIIDFKSMITEIVHDLQNNIPVATISSKFHNTIISIIFDLSFKLRKQFNINKVVLSGGTFQNRYILSGAKKILKENDFLVFTNENIPSNDGGIALGQLTIAAKNINK